MKPLKLSLEAFGPYLQPLELDFTELGNHSLFLIHGPIGAGKTTLLDALCFVLYGVSSGGERESEQMRCDLAPPDVHTEVRLQFWHGGQTFWARREFLPDVPGTAQFWIGEPDHDPEELGWENVSCKVEAMLGLNSHDFRRSAVIPQGQFRQFLMSDVEEREQILGAIFQTGALKRLEAALETHTARLQASMRENWQRREQLVVQGGTHGEEDFHEKLRQARTRVLALETDIRKLREIHGQLSQELTRSAVLQERSGEMESAKAELQRLSAERQRVAAEQERLKQVEAAALLSPYLQQWERAQRDSAEAIHELAEVRDLQPTATPQESLATVQRLQDERGDLQATLQRLEQMAERYQSVRSASTELEQSQLELSQLEDEFREVEDNLRQCRAEIEENGRLQGQGDALRARALTLRADMERVRHWHRKLRQHREVSQSVRRLRDAQQRNQERFQEVKRRVQELSRDVSMLETQGLRNTCLALAAALDDHQPCPVCGSAEHPSLARGEQGPAGGRLLEQKKGQLQQARQLFEKLESEQTEQTLLLARLEERLTLLEQDLAEDQEAQAWSQRNLDEEVGKLHEELRETERQLKRAEDLETDAARLRHRLAKQERAATRLQEAIQRAVAQRSHLQGVLLERSRGLPLEFDSLEAMFAERDRLRRELSTVEDSLELESRDLHRTADSYSTQLAASKAANKNLALAQERERLAHELLQTKLESSPLGSLEVLRAVEPDDPLTLRERLQKEESDWLAAQERLDRATEKFHQSLEAASGQTLTAEEIQARLEAALEDKANTLADVLRLEHWVNEYHRVVETIQQLDPRLATLRRLSRLASGDNPANLTFHRFMLAQLMENVLLAANRRFQGMTRGRYTLQTGKDGLDLTVLDNLSGIPRSVATLSGGESFLASLALALGLSDSVLADGSQDRQGALETLFVDEGFGNLDDDALELALRALIQLQGDGRLVGVVSHLSELRERIPARLEVSAGPGGSQARFVVT